MKNQGVVFEPFIPLLSRVYCSMTRLQQRIILPFPRKYKHMCLHYFSLIVHSNCLIYLSPSLRQSFEKAFETINIYIYIYFQFCTIRICPNFDINSTFLSLCLLGRQEFGDDPRTFDWLDQGEVSELNWCFCALLLFHHLRRSVNGISWHKLISNLKFFL